MWEWVALSACLAAAGAFFAGSFAYLLQLWSNDQNYSHGYLVIPICLALAYRIRYGRSGVGPPVRGELGWGLVSIAFGVMCQLAVTVLRWPVFSYLAIFCVARGLLTCAGGRKWASAFNFPLLFLFFMFPLPVKWTSYAAIWLQDVVSRVSESVLSLFFVCHRVGHTIRIAGVDSSLVVAEECSGLGQIVAFLAFAFLMGHLLARPMWFRAALVLASVPVAILANTLRVVLMNVGAAYFGTQWLGGALHDAPILFSLPVGVMLFFLVDRTLENLLPRKSKSDSEGPAEAPKPASAPLPRASVRALGVAAVALAVAVGVQFGLAEHIRSAGETSFPELRGPLSSLPTAVTDPKTKQVDWAGEDYSKSRDAILAKLPFTADDLLVRGYRHAGGGAAQLYMVYSKAGEDRKHHPEICIRDVSGAPEVLGDRTRIPLGAGSSAEAQRFRFQTGVGRSIVVYYWHYTLAPAPQPGQTPLQELHQRIGVTAPSVTVQISVGGEDKALQAAIENVLLPRLHAGAIQTFLPPGTLTGCDRVPIALAR